MLLRNNQIKSPNQPIKTEVCVEMPVQMCNKSNMDSSLYTLFTVNVCNILYLSRSVLFIQQNGYAPL